MAAMRSLMTSDDGVALAAAADVRADRRAPRPGGACATSRPPAPSSRPMPGRRSAPASSFTIPRPGAILAEVRGLADDGIGIGFACWRASVAFALAAIAADMSRPAA